MSRPRIVWWVKRDARLADNAALTEIDTRGAEAVPLFSVEPSILAAGDASVMHAHAQWQAVSALREALRRRGADILIAAGEVVDKLQKLRSKVPFSAVFSHEEIGNDLTYRRDRAVAEWCRCHGVEYREFPQSSVRRGGVNRDRLQKLWQSRVAEPQPLGIPPITQSESTRRLAATTAFAKQDYHHHGAPWQEVSEVAAMSTLDDFLHRRGRWYRGGISSPNTAMTAGSRLSVHLAWGTITTRQVWHAVQARLRELDPCDPDSSRWRSSLTAFLSRLHWRDHFTQRLESEPELEFRSIHPSYRDIAYENDERLHAAWRDGLTGYPMVDAVMRCLAATGFVNFRMRAMVVSFACHVLHLDWRLIHPHLARVFRDYDPGIHLSQLQMQAGVVGWNAIRVYNPAKQLLDWDAEGRFVRRWLPELRDVPIPVLRQGDRPALASYPAPVVEFGPRARHMQSLLYAVRKSSEARAATNAVYQKHGSRKKEQPRSRRGRRRPDQATLFDGLA